MSVLPSCPRCHSEYTYEDGIIFVCPECSHEWAQDTVAPVSEADGVIKDANGNILQDGDTVTVIKELKIKGSSSGLGAMEQPTHLRLFCGS